MPSVAAQDAAADTKAATASRHKRELLAHGYAFVALKRDFVRPLPPPCAPCLTKPLRCSELTAWLLLLPARLLICFVPTWLLLLLKLPARAPCSTKLLRCSELAAWVMLKTCYVLLPTGQALRGDRPR
jgi:hypothetical protein